MSDGKKVRRLPWLRARFQPALKSEHRELLAQIAKSAPSPNAAYDQAYLETGDIELARACRWLAVTKRDHGTEALKTLLPPVKPRDSRSTSTSERNETMSTGTKPETKPEQPEVMENKIPTLPLRQINFRATVNGVFARVRCIQEFENDADHPVEAVYTFPLPDEATVTACQMRIGKRKVEAVLKERAEARKEYDEAILAGHHGALLEQQRPNIFTMNVGGIEPGEKINVEVDYVQRVPWQAGGGRFRIPLVVAPRFIPGVPTGKQGGGWAEDTDQVPDASKITPPVARGAVSYAADISVSLTPGFACRVESPSHPFAVETHTVRKNDNTEYKTGQIRPDRDFILTYQSTRGIPEVAAFTNTFGNEGFLLTQIIPGTVVPVASDIILLLDISGSMGGPKIDGLKVVAKKVLQKLIGQKTGHNVGIIAFESQPHLLQPLTEVSPVMEKVIDGLSDRGGTELGPALNLAFSQFRDSGRPKMILLVTDGQTESLVHIGTGARIIAAGIDTAVNDSTLKELARNTNGACEWFYPGEDFNAVANRLTGMLSGPVLRDVTVTSQGEAVGISDVFEGLPAAIAIRFSGKVGQAEIRGKTPDGKEASWTIMPKDASACDFCHQLWAREFIRQTAEAEKQVATSLKYGVICNRTSFVAISEKEVPGQKPERVEIPVELPHGWNFDSVFGAPF
ncbi:MAG: VIT domain-containing protein, partial [Patescibacteria group bacterium]